jgi:hypothetical protein
VFPATERRPLPKVEEDGFDDRVVDLGDDWESKEGVIKEFVPVSIDGREEDGEVKEGGVVRSEDVTVVVVGYEGMGVGMVADIAANDDEMVQEHDSWGVESDELSVAQNSWNEGSFRGKSRWPQLNLKRPLPGKATADMNRFGGYRGYSG